MPGSREYFQTNNAISLYDIWPPQSTRIPAPGFMEFTILVDLPLVIITVHLVCRKHAPEYREIHQFYSFTSKLPPLGVGDHEIYNFLPPYPMDATYQVW